jgi:hypothetical protein
MSPARAVVLVGSALILIGCGSSASRAGRDTSVDAGDTNSERDAGGNDQNVREVIADDGSAEDSMGDSSAMADHQLCQDSCDVTAAVPCPDHRTDCVQQCQTLLAEGVCASERRNYIGCIIVATSSAETCMNPPGVTTLLPGFCKSEIAALTACIKGDAAVD